MAFEDLLRSNASIMEAYLKMHQKDSGTLKESDDTGGDGSAYNKYLLATTGDLPKTKEEYEDAPKEKVAVSEGFGEHRDNYAMHRFGHTNPNHTHAIIHKLSNEIHSTHADRDAAVKHQEDMDMHGTHRVVSLDSLRPLNKPHSSLAGLRESTEDDVEARYNKWHSDVQAAHPGKDLKFKWRSESGTHTVSAEVPGEDRSYGVWDHDKDEGHVFTESKEFQGLLESLYLEQTKEPEKLVEEVYVPTEFSAYGKKYKTYAFPSVALANQFLESDAGKGHGYIGQDSSGQYHCAHMDDQGE